jgi:hypothetical protein
MPDYLDTKMTAKLARGADAFAALETTWSYST